MSDAVMWIVVLIAFVLLIRFFLLGGKDAERKGSASKPETPEEEERRNTAMLKLELQRQAAKQKLIEAELESDPARAAKTLRRLMKKK